MCCHHFSVDESGWWSSEWRKIICWGLAVAVAMEKGCFEQVIKDDDVIYRPSIRPQLISFIICYAVFG